MSYDIIGVVKVGDKFYQLYKGEDNKWYKAEKIGETSVEYMNPNTYKSNYNDITPLTDKEFKMIFG